MYSIFKINKEIIQKSNQLEEELWSELWDIVKGNQNYMTFEDWDKEFNGTGMRSWWN